MRVTTRFFNNFRFLHFQIPEFQSLIIFFNDTLDHPNKHWHFLKTFSNKKKETNSLHFRNVFHILIVILGRKYFLLNSCLYRPFLLFPRHSFLQVPSFWNELRIKKKQTKKQEHKLPRNRKISTPPSPKTKKAATNGTAFDCNKRLKKQTCLHNDDTIFGKTKRNTKQKT